MIVRVALLATLLAAATTAPIGAADLSCNGLVPFGKRMICSGFEPNWALELRCAGPAMTAAFIDAFSGSGIDTTPGTVTFSSSNPWSLTTSHGVAGSIAATPAGCTNAGDYVRDFTFTPTAAPGLPGPFFPFCCRIE